MILFYQVHKLSFHGLDLAMESVNMFTTCARHISLNQFYCPQEKMYIRLSYWTFISWFGPACAWNLQTCWYYAVAL